MCKRRERLRNFFFFSFFFSWKSFNDESSLFGSLVNDERGVRQLWLREVVGRVGAKGQDPTPC